MELNALTAELPPTNDVDVYLSIIVRICSAGIVLTSLEWLRRPYYLDDRGLLSWRVNRLDQHWKFSGPLALGLDVLFRYPAFLGLIYLRLAVAILQTFGPRDLVLHPGLVWVAALLALALPFRGRNGLDGADQVAILIFLGLALVQLAPTSLTKQGYLWFLAIQCCLSYLIAGSQKLRSAGWRNGNYLPVILSMRTYCQPTIARFARNHPAAMMVTSWVVILGECSFPSVLVLPLQISLAVLIIALSFHVLIAIIMGLNDFVWAWAAMYPAVVFCLSLRGW